MALNPQYEAIGKGFVSQYYALFDDPIQRPNLHSMYNVSMKKIIFFIFENHFFVGRNFLHDIWGISATGICQNYGKNIGEMNTSYKYNGLIQLVFKFQSLTFQKITRVITAVDSQPTFDGGVLISVLGRLKVGYISVVWIIVSLLCPSYFDYRFWHL